MWSGFRRCWTETAPRALPVTVPEKERHASFGHMPIVLDFFAYVRPARGCDGCYGEAEPLIALRTAPNAAPETMGAVAGNKYLVRFMTQPSGRAGAEAGLGATIVELFNAPTDDPDRLPESTLSSKQMSSRPLPRGKMLTYPFVRLESKGDHGRNEAYRAYAYTIVDALNLIDSGAAVRAGFGPYVARYDAALGDRLRASPSASSADQRKITVLEKFRAAEIEFLRGQDDETYRRLYQGDWAAAFKKVREGEMSRASEADRVQMMAIAGALAGSGARIASRAPAQSPAQLTSQVQSYNDQRSQVDKAFDDSFGAVRQEQAEIAIALETEEIKIRVQSLEELRSRLREIYSRLFR